VGNPVVTQLATDLKQLQVLSQQLLELLHAEAGAVQARDALALNEILKQKQHLVAQVESAEQARNATLKRYSGDLDDETDPLFSQWQGVLDLAARCQQANRDNHSLIISNQRYVNEALHILTGSDTRPQENAYNAHGEQRGGSGRSLGEA
jgi:flagellar biosynthesis/type III secretory pathway chaperone